jgi:hypothetical protein
MIEVHMRIQDELHIFDAKTQGPNVGDDWMSRLGLGTVNQHVPGFRSDQN